MLNRIDHLRGPDLVLVVECDHEAEFERGVGGPVIFVEPNGVSEKIIQVFERLADGVGGLVGVGSDRGEQVFRKANVFGPDLVLLD